MEPQILPQAPPKKRSTSANWSGVLSAGAWPHSAISTTTAADRDCASLGGLARSSRSESRRAGAAPAGRGVPLVPAQVVVLVVGELHHHPGRSAASRVRRAGAAPRISVEPRHCASLQASRKACRRCGSTASSSLTVAERRRAAGVAADALDRRAPPGCGPLSFSTSRRMRPRSTAATARVPIAPPIEGAEPVEMLEAELIDERVGELRIERQAVLRCGCRAPLAEAAPGACRGQITR